MEIYLPTLLILLLNQLLLLVIYWLTRFENRLRFSSYQKSILNRSFIYIFLNMLFFPGLAVPAATNMFKLINENIFQINTLLRSFYTLKNGTFFVNLMIQQICWGTFGAFLQFGKIWSNYLSPAICLFVRKQT